MKISELFKLLDDLQKSIFRDLDKSGNYRRVDEDTARRIVETNIGSIKSKYDNEIS